MRKLRTPLFLSVAALLAWGCLPLVDGRYPGEPVAVVNGTVDFVGIPEDILQLEDFDLALVWRISPEDKPFVSVSRTESRKTSNAGTFTMDIFTLPPVIEGRWQGRLFAFLPSDGVAASWTESWNSSQGSTTRPRVALSCASVIASLDIDGDGLSNEQESGLPGGTSPVDADSNDDGICDGPIAVPGICIGNPEVTPLSGELPVESLLFLELDESAPDVEAWRSCNEGATERFIECQRTAVPPGGGESPDCETRWQTERIEVCGDEPTTSGKPTDGPLNLSCGLSVEEVPFELAVLFL